MDNLKYIIESLLFVSSTPLSMERLRQSVPEVDSKMIKTAMDALEREYESRGGGFSLHHVAGGYQLRTRPEYAQWIKRLHQTQPVRLSKPALETLAIIAYRQPVLRSDIEYIRGVDSGGVLKMLMEKQLIRVLGRDKEKAGRPIIYATTRRFLEIFDLKDLTELPTLKELEELGLAKKQTELETEGPMELIPAMPDAAGFAEFQNRQASESLDAPPLYADEEAPSSEENEDNLEQSTPDDFAVDEDRYPEEVQYPEDEAGGFGETSEDLEGDSVEEDETASEYSWSVRLAEDTGEKPGVYFEEDEDFSDKDEETSGDDEGFIGEDVDPWDGEPE